MRQRQRLTALACVAGFVLVTLTAQSHAQPAKPAPASPTSDSGFKRTPAPANAYCYIGWPNDNETVRTTHIKVWFGTRNFGVAPAGTNKPNTGHHHLLIDTALPPLDQPIPNDKNHLHFGLGGIGGRRIGPSGRGGVSSGRFIAWPEQSCRYLRLKSPTRPG